MTEMALVGGTVIDGTGRPPIPEAVVTVADGRIQNVGRRADFGELPGNVVDVSGKFLLPGLIDCHTHIAGLHDDSYVQVEDHGALVDLWMREHFRNGITTVRDTGNSDPDESLARCRQARSGWPRFFGAGPVLDGPADPPTPWRWLWTVDEVDEAKRIVAELVTKGVDFIKVYVWMRAEVMRAIADEAHRHGVQVTGHVGHVTTVEQAVRAGIDSLEHVRMGPELLSAADRERYDALPRRALDPLANYRSWRYADAESPAADALIELLIERGIYWTPTLTWSLSILLKDDPGVTDPAGIDVVPERVQEQWKNYVYYFDYSEEDFERAKDEMANQMRFVGRAQRAGVKVTAGTDTSNPSVVPGHSLHKELELLVQAGLSPMEALVAATGRAAELLGKQNEFGTIQKRRYADFLVLDADPLESIGNTRRITAVLREGKEEVGALTA